MNRWLASAGFHGAMAVAFGAWAAHAAENVLPREAVDWIKTGSAYQLWHAVALLGIAAIAARSPARLVTASALAFALGALLFSGSLYLLALMPLLNSGGLHGLVYVTPFGGGLLILGWLLLLVAGLRMKG